MTSISSNAASSPNRKSVFSQLIALTTLTIWFVVWKQQSSRSSTRTNCKCAKNLAEFSVVYRVQAISLIAKILVTQKGMLLLQSCCYRCGHLNIHVGYIGSKLRCDDAVTRLAQSGSGRVPTKIMAVQNSDHLSEKDR